MDKTPGQTTTCDSGTGDGRERRETRGRSLNQGCCVREQEFDVQGQKGGEGGGGNAKASSDSLEWF